MIGGRYWSDTPTSQGTSRIAGQHLKLKKQGRIVPYRFLRECGPADALISDLHSLEL